MEKTSYVVQINNGGTGRCLRLDAPLSGGGLARLMNYSEVLSRTTSVVYQETKVRLLSGKVRNPW